MKFREALKGFIDHEVTVTTREDEYCGILTEIGDDYVRIYDGTSDCLINLVAIESVTNDK